MLEIEQILKFEDGAMDHDEQVAFLQRGINEGWVWKLQGFYGRAAMACIESGACHHLTEEPM